MTRCPHSNRDARGCTQCAGIVPQRITAIGSALYIDGQLTDRVLDHERVITARKTQRRRRK